MAMRRGVFMFNILKKSEIVTANTAFLYAERYYKLVLAILPPIIKNGAQ